MIAELFLICALAERSASFRHPLSVQWEMGRDEINVIRMLRDYEDGHTASRPQKLVTIYGHHPNWVKVLNDAGIRTLGVWEYKVKWPNYMQAHPHGIPLKHGDTQVYIFDALEEEYPPTEKIIWTASQITSYWGFFLYRPFLCPTFHPHLVAKHWERMVLDFHDFQIWWRNSGLRSTELNHEEMLFEQLLEIMYKKGERPFGGRHWNKDKPCRRPWPPLKGSA